MKKKYYAYIISDEHLSGTTDDWAECERIVSGKSGARYKGFLTRKDAEDWLKRGGAYPQAKGTNKPLPKAVYFDAGTGRGLGLVEVKVTDETGKSLLDNVLTPKMITRFGTHVITDREATNNYGELLAMKYALQIAAKEGIKKIFGDSKLVLSYWSKGRVKDHTLSDNAYDLIDEVAGLRKEFEADGGIVNYISGDDNPADLGFHR